MMASSQAILTLCCLSWLLCSTVSACSSSGQHELYRVVRKTDEGGKQLVVATDEDARLYCRTNVPWKKCWWKPPRNGVRQVSSTELTQLTGSAVTQERARSYFKTRPYLLSFNFGARAFTA